MQEFPRHLPTINLNISGQIYSDKYGFGYDQLLQMISLYIHFVNDKRERAEVMIREVFRGIIECEVHEFCFTCTAW